MEAAEMDRLYRSRDDRMLAGVAGGLAEMWDADPALVRIVWALLVIFTGGLALVVYIVMAIVVPEEDDTWHAAAPAGMAPGGAAMGGAATGAAATGAAATGAAAPPPGTVSGTSEAPTPTGSGWVTPPPTSRQLRAEARAARRAARGERGFGTTGGVILGGFLVLLGVFFLVRQYLPSIDFDWFWPLILVGLGAVLLVSAVGRGPRSGGPG